MNRTHGLRLFHLFNHLAVIFGLYSFFSWFGLAVAISIYCLMGCLGISIGYHRLLSHRSFTPKTWFKSLCLFCGVIATGGSPLSWVAAHRMHHSHSDSDRDVHSLKRDGILRVYFHFWQPFVVSRRQIRDLLKDAEVMTFHKWYFLILVLYATLLYSHDFQWGLYGYSLPATLAFHFYGLINVLGHSQGLRPFETDDKTYNNRFANIFTFGEGWHQNHHFVSSSHRIGLRSNEYDIAAWILETLPVCSNRNELLKKKAKWISVIKNEELFFRDSI